MPTSAEWGKWIYLAFLIPLIFIRIHHRVRRRDAKTSLDRKDWVERVLLGQAAMLMMLVPLTYALTPLLDFANVTLPVWTLAPGVNLFVVGIVLLARTHVQLGRNWSQTLQVRQDHQLVTTGVYARIRHPMYAALWLVGLALPFLLHNLIAGYSYLASFALLYLVRVPREERMMRDAFGDAYREYEQRTGRVIPRPRRLP